MNRKNAGKRHILHNVDSGGEDNHAVEACAPTADNTDSEVYTNWRSIYIASALSFTGTAQFSLYFSSLWPYLQVIDRSISENFFGYVIAIYSLGQIFASPLFGYLSNRIGRVRPLLFVGLLLMFVGNAAYLALEIVTFPKRYLLLIGRFITGAGSGNVMLLRTYASTASTATDRSKAIAFVTCGQAVGLTSGPALQLLFTSLRYPGTLLLNWPRIHFNLYTAPAYLACAMNFFAASLLYFWFHEEYVGLAEGSKIEILDEQESEDDKSLAGENLSIDHANNQRMNKISISNGKCENLSVIVSTLENRKTEKNETVGNSSVTNNSSSALSSSLKLKHGSRTELAKLPSYDMVAVLVCLATRFSYMFINTNLETIGSPYSMMMFAWAESTTVFYTSLAQGGIGLLTLGTYLAWIFFRLERHVSYRIGCICALFAFIVFHLITYPWPFISGHVPIQNSTTRWALELIDSDGEPLGCDSDRFAWCTSLPPVNVWLYYITYVITLGLAFPILNVVNSTLYADVLGPRRQGTQQGILQVSGGMARLLGPIIISILYSAYGPTMAWKMEIFVVFLTILPWLIFYRRMIPLMKRHRLKAVGLACSSAPPSQSGREQQDQRSAASAPGTLTTNVTAKTSTITCPGNDEVGKQNLRERDL